MLNSTLMAVETPRLFYPRIDPEKLIIRKELPDPEPGPYRSYESRLRSGKLTEEGELPTSLRVDLQKEFWDIGTQAVVQVSSIHLDQERPWYTGEDWHVQGQLVSKTYCSTNVLSTNGRCEERTHLRYSHVLLQQRKCGGSIDILPASL